MVKKNGGAMAPLAPVPTPVCLLPNFLQNYEHWNKLQMIEKKKQQALTKSFSFSYTIFMILLLLEDL